MISPVPAPSSAPSAAAGRNTDQAGRLRALVQSLRSGTSRPAVSEGGQPARQTPPVICVCSGKGGVGKTMLAVNLSLCLARRGVRPVLIDADVGTPNADLVLGVNASRRLDHAQEAPLPATLAAMAVPAPHGLRLLAGIAGNTWITDFSLAQCRHLLEATGQIEPRPRAIVVDAGAGIGPTVMHFATLADLALVVVTPDPTSIADAYATIKALHQRITLRSAASSQPGPWSPGIVVNEAVDAAEARRTFDRVSQCAQRFLGISPRELGWIPVSEDVRRSVRRRAPLAGFGADSAALTAIDGVAGSLYGIFEMSDNRTSASTSPARFLRRIMGVGYSSAVDAR